MEEKGVTPRILLLSLSACLILLQLATGIGLFYLHLGFSPESVAAFYRGNMEMFAAPKTVQGLLKTTLPHLVAMTVVGIFLLHLLQCDKGCKGVMAGLFFGGMFLDIGSGYLILLHPLFAWLKLAGFVMLMGGASVAAWYLVRAATKSRVYKD